MAVRTIDVKSFLQEERSSPERTGLLDVRTPDEYVLGHIPGAINMPLFTNDERAEVGTLYKQKGPESAMLRGLDFVGPKMRHFVERGRSESKNGQVTVQCWRGGQRSASVAWLLDFAGLDVQVVHGGYKAYRNAVLDEFAACNAPFIILGGRTGSYKTEILHALAARGEQVIDLEGLANHKGSAFGSIGEDPQPTTQQFENNLADALRQLDHSGRIWLENESKSIGRVYIPDVFWAKMKSAPLLHLDVPVDKRVGNLVETYGAVEDIDLLKDSFDKIAKRLGGKRHKEAHEALDRGDIAGAARIALHYYDRTYDYNLSVNKAPEINILDIGNADPESAASIILSHVNSDHQFINRAKQI